MPYRERQQVWLKPFDNGLTVEPRQHGTIISVTPNAIVVELDPEFRDSVAGGSTWSHDDGIREITVDQIESVMGELPPLPEPPPFTGETIGDLVRRALRNARDNGYTFDGWTDAQVAADLIEYDAELEGASLETITIVVREVRTAK